MVERNSWQLNKTTPMDGVFYSRPSAGSIPWSLSHPPHQQKTLAIRHDEGDPMNLTTHHASGNWLSSSLPCRCRPPSVHQPMVVVVTRQVGGPSSFAGVPVGYTALHPFMVQGTHSFEWCAFLRLKSCQGSSTLTQTIPAEHARCQDALLEVRRYPRIA